MGLPWEKPYRGRIHIWDYPEGNQAIRTPSPVQGLTGDPGDLTPVLGRSLDCSAQSDCRGGLEDSTRVHRPGNWTGGEKRRSYPRVRGNGAASVTPASSSRPLLTQHTGRDWLNAEIVESCEGVWCRPARSSADVCQRNAMRRGNTPSGVSPHPQGARLALRLVRQGNSTIQWANLCLETAFPFCCPPWQTKSCSELLTLRVRSTYSTTRKTSPLIKRIHFY